MNEYCDGSVYVDIFVKKIKILLLLLLNRCIRKIPFLTKFLFGVKIVENYEIHWDFTTIVLKWALLLHSEGSERFLEIGTGPYAILSILLARRGYKHITACDINKTYIVSAEKTCILNNSSVELVQSDLFSNIHEKYNIIFFNAVYIPEKVGNALNLNTLHIHQCHWCGGKFGIEIINRFLTAAHDHLTQEGKVMLGFNPYHLQRPKLSSICFNNDFQIAAKVQRPFLPSTVFILKRRKK